MTDINQKLLTGERACFQAENMTITQSVFADGESPLKESRYIVLENDIFRWKYPLWYSRDVKARKIQLLDTARSGIWYTHQINILTVSFKHLRHFVVALPLFWKMSKCQMLKKVSGHVRILS